MKLIKFSIDKPVTVSMMVLIIIVFGAVSFFKLPVDFLPDLQFPIATVITTYSGVAPEEIENLVTKPIEETVNTVDNIKKVTSFSQEGMSTVVVEFNWGTNMDFAAQDIREKIDQITKILPEDVDDPLVFKFDPADMPVIWMGISSNNMSARQLRDYATDYVKDRLERVEGVAAAYVMGGEKREILINIDKNKLESYGLSLDFITNKIRTENKNLPGGKIKTVYKEYLIRSVGEFENVKEIENIILTNVNGSTVKLKDVATVLDTTKERTDISRLNGIPDVGIAIMKQAGSNTLEVSNRARETLAEIEKELPGDLKLAISFDQGLYIRRSADYVTGNLYSGALLAMIVIFLFLKNIRATIIIGLSIPISVIATFILIYFKGMTLNAMSLGGLALGVGMLVDNSVVVLENIYRHISLGEHRLKAAYDGSKEVGMAILGSTLTTVVVFLPIAFTTGIAGKVFKELAWTVTFSLTASLIVALTIVPMLSSKLLKLSKKEMEVELRLGKTKGLYYRMIDYALGNRWKIILISFSLFAVSIFLASKIGSEFMSQSDSNEVIITYEMPKGTSLKETNRVVSVFEQEALKMPEIGNVFLLVGFNDEEVGGGPNMGEDQGSNTGFIVVSLKEDKKVKGVLDVLKGMFSKTEEKKKTNLNQIIDTLREKINVPELKMKFQDASSAIMGMGTPIQIKIFGNDLKVLAELSEKVYGSIKDVPGLVDLNATTLAGKPELQINYDRDKLADFNLTVEGVSETVKTAMHGNIASQFREAGEEYNIRVQMQERYRANTEDLQALIITSMDGRQVRLGEIATISNVAGPSKIDRENQKRYVMITGDTSEKDLGNIVKSIEGKLSEMIFPPGYYVEFGGEAKEMKEAFVSLAYALILAIVLVYMVMAAEFESLIDSFVIMFTLPLALVGVIFALYFTGYSLSVPAFIGIIILVGVVVNNGIVLIEYIIQLRKEGNEKHAAIREAGVTRLRPILITSLTTIIGLAPMALGIGEGAETRAPMAIAIIGGLTVATFLTLIVIPVTYSLIESAGVAVRNKIKWVVLGEKEEG